IGREVTLVVGGCEHLHLVPARDQVLGEVADVEVDPTRDVPRVRGEEPDAHAYVSPSAAMALSDARASLSVSRSSVKTFWSMCQSCGYSAMRAICRSTQRWVMSAIASRCGRSGGSIGPWKSMTTPHGLPARRRRSP